jgi:hypothetical protein
MQESYKTPESGALEETNRTQAGMLDRARAAGGFVVRAAPAGTGWLGDRVEDIAKWPANLIRYLPARVSRFIATTIAALAAATTFPFGAAARLRKGRGAFRPWLAGRGRAGLLRAVQIVFEVFDIFGIPELFAFLLRAATRATPLRGEEITAAASVLGPAAVRYQDVRVAESGVLRWVFKRNGGRAFAVFHTVNLPVSGPHAREHLDIVLHELVHVYQYERTGSRYVAESLLAQREEGYGYGGSEGLIRARAQGRRLADYNREQQAQIVQDYYLLRRAGHATSAFEPFIAELRQGRI